MSVLGICPDKSGFGTVTSKMNVNDEMKQVLGQIVPCRFVLFAIFNRKTRQIIILRCEVFCRFEAQWVLAAVTLIF